MFSWPSFGYTALSAEQYDIGGDDSSSSRCQAYVCKAQVADVPLDAKLMVAQVPLQLGVLVPLFMAKLSVAMVRLLSTSIVVVMIAPPLLLGMFWLHRSLSSREVSEQQLADGTTLLSPSHFRRIPGAISVVCCESLSTQSLLAVVLPVMAMAIVKKSPPPVPSQMTLALMPRSPRSSNEGASSSPSSSADGLEVVHERLDRHSARMQHISGRLKLVEDAVARLGVLGSGNDDDDANSDEADDGAFPEATGHRAVSAALSSPGMPLVQLGQCHGKNIHG